jgi:hypothetical protein
MKTRPSLKNHARKDWVQMAKHETYARRFLAVCQHRRGPFEFSCGFTGPRARFVEQSLDEKERRGS